MNREELINDALEALSWEKIGPGRYQERFGETDAELRRAAADVLDAILPQVSTVEELEALPAATKLIVNRNGCAVQRVRHGRGFVLGANVECSAEDVLGYAGDSLTVVWQP